MKRLIVLALILVLAIQPFLAIIPSIVIASSTTYQGTNYVVKDTYWEEYKDIHNLPSYINRSILYTYNNQTITIYFNKELWEELGLIVYGDYGVVNLNPSKDFKEHSKYPSTNPTGPYYTRDNKKGEYRYHGVSISGGKVNNINFPDDVAGSNNLKDRTWWFEPWNFNNENKDAYDSFIRNVGSLSLYNDRAIKEAGTPDADLVAKWINESVDFITSGTINGNDKATNLNAVHYFNIESAQRPYESGQGTMLHKSNYSGNTFYQTFNVAKYEKEATTVTAAIEDVLTTDVNSSGDITLVIKATSELMDDEIIGDSIQESIYYYREDVAKWEFTLTDNVTGSNQVAIGSKKNDKKIGYHDFTLTIPFNTYKNMLNADDQFSVNFNLTAKAIYTDNNSDQGTASRQELIDSSPMIEEYVEPTLPEPIKFTVNAPKRILDVNNFSLALNEINVASAVDRYVSINGQILSEADETKFLSGQYKFPKLMQTKIYDYTITYKDEIGNPYFFSSYVIVYDSVPHAQVIVGGTHKENRKVTVSADSSITSDYLESRSNVQISQFTITTPDGEPLYFGTNTNQLKEFLRKTAGDINVAVTVSNEYGSRSYNHSIYIAPDYEPDIISIIWNNVLTRNETLDIFSEGASLDGDTIVETTYKIYYDTNKDNNPETLVYSGIWEGTTPYIPDKLGNYKIVFTTKEEFGEETISQHITEADKRIKTLEREFFVDNLIPMTKIYTDIEYNFPSLDVAFLTDQGLPRAENDYLRNYRVDIMNSFRVNSMVANVDVWDLYTYTYSQTAYKTLHTGSSYPPPSTSYNSGGYSGTLYRYDVDNYKYTVDNSYYITKSDSRPEDATRGGSGWTEYGYWNGSWSVKNTGSTNYPSSLGYNSNGYSGTLYRYTTTHDSTSGSLPSNPENGDRYTITKYYTAYYSGTVTKTWTEYVEDVKTYNDYYGDYSGTVYKYVKQSYTPSYDTESNKYIVYVAKNSLNNVSDLNYLKNIARDAKVILIGNPALASQLANDYFIPYSSDTSSLVNQVISITKAENPISNELSLLVNQSFNLNYSDIDEEGDPIVESGFQYVHNPNYFDNPQGLEAGAVATYSETGYSSTKKNSFSKPGKYIIYRRIKDQPVGFSELGKYSNLSTIEVVVHRKPVASATLDWDYDNILGTYLTTWVDNSYDPDFQYSDPNRGIVATKIKYRKNSGSWIYEIPDNLDYGTYDLEYIVMDKHGVWSNPFTTTFTLAAAPGMQILDAKLKAAAPQFTTASIPASETLLIYDVLTRFPYTTYLDIAIYQGVTKKTVAKIVNYTEGVTGSKTANDISWNDISYNIPATLADGSYTVKVTAIGIGGKTATVALPFTVNTPAHLQIIDFPADIIPVEESYILQATTSRYVTTVQVTMYQGTSYQTTISLSLDSTNGATKSWSTSYIAPINLPENTYTAKYEATTANGNTATAYATTKISQLQITGFVNHTDKWNENRIKYNRSKTGTDDAPRTYDVFFPGELLLLNAEITGSPIEIRATILEKPYTTYLFDNGQGNWTGELWHEDMLKWKSQIITIRFTARTAAGTIKTYDVLIIIDDDPYWRQHRLF